MKRTPKVGETLYRLPIGNAARRDGADSIEPVMVRSVGRKYFKASPVRETGAWDELEFHLDNWMHKSDFSSCYQIYESDQEWQEEREAQAICGRLGDLFGSWGPARKLSIVKLRTIMTLLQSEGIA